jgi:homoserine kinase type II
MAGTAALASRCRWRNDYVGGREFHPKGADCLDAGRDAIDVHALARALADSYRLRVVGLSPLEGGSLNAGYRVQAADGDFHLKRYDGRIYRTEHIRRSLEAQEYAGRSGVPVPAVRLNTHGDAITDVPRVGSVVLSTFIRGSHHRRGSIPARAAGAMGRTLGTLHRVLAPFDEPRPYAVPPPAEAQTRLEGVLSKAERRRDRNAVDDICCRVLRHKLDGLRRHGWLADRFPPLLAQATHGDYQETNILFDDADQIVGVLDFDNARFNPRVVEVSRVLSLDFLPDGRLLPEADDFLVGYHDTGRLTEPEARVLAPLRLYLSCTSAWPIEPRYEDPDAYQPRWDRFIREPSNWWEEHADELTERLLHLRHRTATSES